MPRNRNNGNGRSATAERARVFDPTNFEEQFSVAQDGGESVARELLQPGDDAVSLLMRTDFRNERQAIAATRMLAKCREFHIDWGLLMLRDLFASLTSINGVARKQFMQAHVGVIIEQLNRRRDATEKRSSDDDADRRG